MAQANSNISIFPPTRNEVCITGLINNRDKLAQNSACNESLVLSEEAAAKGVSLHPQFLCQAMDYPFL